MIKLQTLWIELYKFTRTHTTVQLSHFLTNVWKSFMSLSHKELLNRQEAIDAMTWRRLKHLSNTSPCDPSPGPLHMGPRANVTQSLTGIKPRTLWLAAKHATKGLTSPQSLIDISCPAWLSRQHWIFSMFCPFIAGLTLWLLFWTMNLLWAKLTLDLDDTHAVPLPENWRIHGPCSVLNFSNK